MQKQDDIRDRLDDAKILWENDRKNGAFIMALIALAGLASIRYPKKKTPPKVYFDKIREYHPKQAIQITAKEKKQKSKSISDGQQFKCVVLDLVEEIIAPNFARGAPKYNVSIPFSKDKKTNIEDLFYNVLRCTALHQGTFSSVAYLTKRTPKGDILRLSEPAGIPEYWMVHLIDAVGQSPELT